MARARIAAALPALLLAWAAGAAADQPAIVVTPGSARTFRVALQRFAEEGSVGPARAEALRAAIGAALEYSGVFELLDRKAFLGPETTVFFEGSGNLVCSDWTQIGSDVLVEGELRVEAGQLGVAYRAWDAARCAQAQGKRYTQPASADLKIIATRIADDIVEAFIGIRGVASTEIAFISDRGGNPEVYVMDADGGNPRPATANRSINGFPAWSPDGSSILYTSYRYLNRPVLFLSTRGNGRPPGRLLGSIDPDLRQYRGVWNRSGDRLAVVMSADYPSEIFTVRPDGRGLRRLTDNAAIEVSPSWSPDGSQIAFVSDRTGSPQLYLMRADGSDVRRLTYQGDYNTSPAWSPDGSWIAYESRVDGQLDLWLIDPGGRVNVPLVTHPRSDESPSWAANSRKLAFSSKRRGRADIYVIDVNGENLRRLTDGAGENKSPAWGWFPR